MECKFVVGQHVVLTDDKGFPASGKGVKEGVEVVVPKKGIVYTVRKLMPSAITGEPLILLAEIVNPPIKFKQGMLEPPFAARRFKPLDRLKVEDFTEVSEPA